MRFIRFDISGGALAYEPGDIMMVYPKNQPDRVNELLELLGMDGDKCLRIFLNDEDAKLPASWRLTNPCTTLQAAINLWDFQVSTALAEKLTIWRLVMEMYGR